MSKAISIRVQPQTGRQAGGQRRHDLRDPAHVPGYVDQSRTHQNSVIIEPPDPATVRAEIAEHRRQAGQQKLRADARTTIGGIITFGKDAQPVIEALPREEQEALFLRVAQRMAKEAERPLLGLVVHRDESAVHAHFTLRGYKLENGKEVAPRLSRTDLQRIQDAAAQEVAHLGIERGVSRAIREARGDDRAKVVHRSVRELHEALPREIEAAQARKLAIEQAVAEAEKAMQAAQEKSEKNRRLIEQQDEKLRQGRVTEEQVEKRIKVYERRMQAATAEIGRALDALHDGLYSLGLESRDQRKAAYEAVQDLLAGSGSLSDGLYIAVKASTAMRDAASEIAREHTIPARVVEASRTVQQEHRQRQTKRERGNDGPEIER